ncbi:MAG TPA: acylphosphatase, partial [Candidatus Binatia bacterium]
MGNKARVRAQIEGRVQGVFFRASAEAEANRLGVKGWVRNRPEGSVELVAEGERENLDDLIAWCRRGPRHAE